MIQTFVSKSERRSRLLGCGIRFFLTAALTGNQTAGGYAPFALGCVAAAGPGPEGVSALLGAAAGAAVFLDFAGALPFLAVAVLILAAATAFRGSETLSRPEIVSLTAVVLFLSVTLIYVLESFDPAEELTACLAAAGLTGAAAWFFTPLLHPDGERDPAEGVLFLSAALLLAMQEVTVAGLSVGRILLCALLAWTAFVHGPAAGAAAGLGTGLTADLCAGGGTGLLTAAMGAGGFLSGRYHGGRRWRAALLFLAGDFAALLGSGNPLEQPMLAECGLGMAFFLTLPPRLFPDRPAMSDYAAGSAAEELRKRLDRAAAALRELYDCCTGDGAAENEDGPSEVFDRAAERVCRTCALCDLCWETDYAGTYQALNDAMPRLLDRGRLNAGDLPAFFTDRCLHMGEFLSAVNTELSSYFLRRRYRKQLEETRRSARGQYVRLSELLSAAASSETGTAVPAFAAERCRLGTTLRPRKGEDVCGDTAESFRTEGGVWCLLLADGMGSGQEARRESALTCRLLRQFLEAGIHPEAALKTLNAAMALRGEETDSFSTLDLCTFDAAGAEASFYKYGAAPSYLKRGGVVRRITGASLPVGLRTDPAEPDITRMRLDPGSFAVMVSDGVADAEEDDWLQDLLAGWEGDEPQKLADAIMEESVRRRDLSDDCAVQVFYRPAGARRV